MLLSDVIHWNENSRFSPRWIIIRIIWTCRIKVILYEMKVNISFKEKKCIINGLLCSFYLFSCCWEKTAFLLQLVQCRGRINGEISQFECEAEYTNPMQQAIRWLKHFALLTRSIIIARTNICLSDNSSYHIFRFKIS